MKCLVFAFALFLFTTSPSAQTISCEEIAKRTEQTFKKMDDALKLKTGMLLGEMEAAKGALQGCIDRNQAVSTQMALVWFLGDLGLVAILALLFFHQRRMQRAIRYLSGILKSKDPEHTVKYVPSQGLFHWAFSLVVAAFLVLNLIALFL